MELRIKVSAAILDHHKAKIGISRFQQSRQDYAARRDSVKNQRIDFVGTEDHGEIGAGKCADAMLGNDDLTVSWRYGRRDLSQRFLE